MSIGLHQPIMINEVYILGHSLLKVLFTVRYTNRQITALTFFAITKTITKIAKKWDY